MARFLSAYVGIVPQVINLARIFGEMEELAERFIQKVDQFPILRAHHGHELGLLQDAVAAMFGKDNVAAGPSGLAERRQDGLGLPILGHIDLGQFHDHGSHIHELQRPSTVSPPSKRPGAHTTRGTRVMTSYIVHF